MPGSQVALTGQGSGLSSQALRHTPYSLTHKPPLQQGKYPYKHKLIIMATNFHHFHQSWTDQLQKLTTQLSKTPAEDHHQALRLVDKVVTLYEDYYRARSSLAKRDVLSLFAAPWASALERALHWVAGFRPTTIFHLVYTESSIRFESRVADILRGRRTGDLGELTPAQLARVSELQCLTVKEENDIGDELGKWQEAVAGAELAELYGNAPDGLEDFLERLGQVVIKADDLRMKTLQRVVQMLTPQQAVEFLIAATELHFGIQGWGSHLDRLRSGKNPCFKKGDA